MDQVLATGGSITIIHFMREVMVPPSSIEPEGPPRTQLRIVCMPNMTEFHQTLYHPNYQRTDDVRAVTCPACMKTPLFKESQKILEAALGSRIRA